MREEKYLVNSRSTEARLTGLRGGGRLYRQGWVAHFHNGFVTAHAWTWQNVFPCGFGDLNSNWALKQSGRRIILNEIFAFWRLKLKRGLGVIAKQLHTNKSWYHFTAADFITYSWIYWGGRLTLGPPARCSHTCRAPWTRPAQPSLSSLEDPLEYTNESLLLITITLWSTPQQGKRLQLVRAGLFLV